MHLNRTRGIRRCCTQSFHTRFESAMRWRSKKSKPIPCAQPFEKREALDAIKSGAAHEAQAKNIGSILHRAARLHSSASTIPGNNVRKFVPASKGEFVIVARESCKPSRDGNVVRIAVRINAAFRNKNKPCGAVRDGGHRHCHHGLVSIDCYCNGAARLFCGDFIEQCFGDKRTGVTARGNFFDALAIDRDDLVAHSKPDVGCRTTSSQCSDNRTIAHTEKLRQQGPVLLCIGATIVKDRSDVGRLRRTRGTGRVTQSPLNLGNPAKVLPEAHRPRRVLRSQWQRRSEHQNEWQYKSLFRQEWFSGFDIVIGVVRRNLRVDCA